MFYIIKWFGYLLAAILRYFLDYFMTIVLINFALNVNIILRQNHLFLLPKLKSPTKIPLTTSELVITVTNILTTTLLIKLSHFCCLWHLNLHSFLPNFILALIYQQWWHLLSWPFLWCIFICKYYVSS